MVPSMMHGSPRDSLRGGDDGGDDGPLGDGPAEATQATQVASKGAARTARRVRIGGLVITDEILPPKFNASTGSTSPRAHTR
jgi:hypothetical protein